MNLFDLRGQRVIVVGGAGDIGFAILEGLLEAGAVAVAIDISHSLIQKVKLLQERKYQVHALIVDIRDRDAIKKSVSDAEDLLGGHIDIMVNAAGIQRRASSEKFSNSDWDDVLSINLTAAFLYSKEVAQGMIQKGRGKIIHIASIMSQFGGITIPAYAASKGGIVQLTKALSNDLAGMGVCVNAVSPGYIDTQLNTTLINDEKRSNEVMLRTPLKRWGKPADLKGAVIFLASPASDYVTGTVLTVDGGYSAR